MESLLVVGVDTVAGANLAACLSERYRIFTWSAGDRYDIPNCSAVDPADAPRAIASRVRPDWIIYCGPASRSAWEPDLASAIDDSLVASVEAWCSAAKEAQARFAMISSDAVFTGPWMFHDEESTGICDSFQAVTIRAAEQQACEIVPETLLIRTNTFGWSAAGDQQGWIESLLNEIESKRMVEQDHVRHATPILATDLAAIVERACLENLQGLYHVGGAERICPLKFAQRLADQFDLPWLSIRRESSVDEPARGFGAGECSLQTKRIRKALCVAMPLLSEGLSQLKEQAQNGYRERLSQTPATVQVKAA